jgi:hypothetical protein
MINRFINAMGWAVMLFAFVVFLVSYAGFPDQVLVYINEKGDPVQYVSKNLFFYLLLSVIVALNAALLILNSMLRKANDYPKTQFGASAVQIFFNLFFATSVYFVNILNSRENFNYSNFGYLIYITGGLLAVALVYTVISRFILKN